MKSASVLGREARASDKRRGKKGVLDSTIFFAFSGLVPILVDISVNSSPSLSQSTRKSVCQPGNTLIGKEDDGGGNLLDDLGVLGDHGGRQGVELLSVSEDDDLVGLPVLGGGGGLELRP